MRASGWKSLVLFLGMALGSASGAEVQNWITPGNIPAVESVTLRNPACEAVIWTKPFVRLASFRLADGRNHLVGFASPNPVADGRLLRPLFVTGGRLWLTGVPRGDLIGLLPGTATPVDGGVEVAVGPDPGTGLSARVRFVLDARLPRLTVTSTLRNSGSSPCIAGCWWPISFEPGGQMESEALPFPEEPRFRFFSWHHDVPVTEPACRIDGGRIVLDLDRPLRDNLFEIGFLGREVVVAKPDCRYRFTVLDPAPDPSRTYPQEGSAVILYRDQRTLFCEAELEEPDTNLAPGAQTSFRFAVSLETPGSPTSSLP